jgi:cysteine desulfurase/selenocysteine lyase
VNAVAVSATGPAAPAPAYDLAAVRAEFPILATLINGRRLAFLDSGASSQRPLAVLQAVDDYERHSHANVHRGVHTLSQRATELLEAARIKLQRFVGAVSPREIIFTRGTTEAINLVAQSWGAANLKPGDEILLTTLEHHANIVPWQMLCQRSGAVLKIAPITRQGELPIESFRALLGPRTRLAAFAHVSNALGTVLPVRELCALARSAGALSLVDGAQAVPHLSVDVRDIGCDFYAFSGHKMYGPTGIGVLWARTELLDAMPPWQGGGDMIRTVSFERSTYNEIPAKFEAGTPNISGAIGLGAAAEFVQQLFARNLHAHEQSVLSYAAERLTAVPGLALVGQPARKSGVISFTLQGIHPHDLGTVLDSEGVAVRTGHHCAMPLMEFLGLPATARATLGCYSGQDDIDQLFAALLRAREVFG